MRNFSHPHTGEHVRELVDEVLREWEIPVSKVVAILTDNGSNMLRAFSTLVQDKESNDEESENMEVEVDKSEHDDFEFKETEHEVTFFGFIKRIS